MVKGVIRAGEGTIGVGHDLVPPHSLTKFLIQRYQNESKFHGVYSRNNLPKKKGWGIYNKSGN